MENSNKIFHIYLPTDLFLSRNVRRMPQFLVGCFEVAECTSFFQEVKTCIVSIVRILIIGIQSDAKKLLKDSELFYIGEINAEEDRTSSEYFNAITNKRDTTIWLNFSWTSRTLKLDKIYFKGQIISLTTSLILTFNPIILSRYLKLNEFISSQNIIPRILISNLSEYNYISNQRKHFMGFIPFESKSSNIKKNMNSSTVTNNNTKQDFKWKIMGRSLGLKQIHHKFSSILQVVQEDLSWITIGNILIILMIDSFFGTLVSSYLKEFPNLYSLILERVESMLQVLLQLIGWLGGSPAGLKLNTALNALMGRFFSYHLHLWRNYIGILEPLLSFILSTLINVGFCGFTLQISLAKDLLSIATFHIYCLYIYATRLFNVELNTLKSLGRLFFGRKWNPLRNRIDSIHLSNSEMFLSSMGFTISVFLAPTAILYYIVFLSLRLPCLIMESLLSILIQAANSLEPVTFFLIATNSSWVANDIYIQPIRLDNGSSSEIQSYEIRTQTTQKLFNFPNFRKPIRNVLCKIFQSEVITQ